MPKTSEEAVSQGLREGLKDLVRNLVGKLGFFIIVGLILLFIGSYVLGTITGWFDGLFGWEIDLWPLGDEEKGTWFKGTFGGSEEAVTEATQPVDQGESPEECTIWGRNVPSWATKCK